MMNYIKRTFYQQQSFLMKFKHSVQEKKKKKF